MRRLLASALLLVGCVPEAEKPDDADGDGWSELDGDCDDADAGVHPEQAETCDGVDQDCDGATDEDPVDPLTAWDDADGDGYGAGAPRTGCGVEGATVDGDCDDADGDVNPGAGETCGNGHDDDCDGGADDCLPSGAQALGGVTVTGPGNATFGAAVAAIADQTGDGLPDLVVGSWGRDAPADPTGTAFVWVWSVAMDARLDTAQAAVAISGFDQPDQRAGFALATGDLTGDGEVDLLVGAPGGAGAGPDWGAVYLLEGPLEPAEQVPGYVTDVGYFPAEGCGLYEMGTANDEFGTTVTVLPDVDGDGVDDFAVGAPGYPEASRAGRVSVFPGGAIDAVSGEPVGTIRARDPDVELGWVVAGLPDWDGAGHGRVLLGSPRIGSHAGGFALVEIVTGDLVYDDLPVRVEGESADDALGNAFAWDGDVGVVLVGAPGGPEGVGGEVWQVGPDALVAGTWRVSEVGAAIPTPVGASGHGAALAVGDVDGDDVTDLLAGAVYGGTAHVHSSLGGAWSYAGTPWSLGAVVATVDGDGDPFMDLVLPDPATDTLYVVRGTGW